MYEIMCYVDTNVINESVYTIASTIIRNYHYVIVQGNTNNSYFLISYIINYLKGEYHPLDSK